MFEKCARFVYRLGHRPFTAVRRGSIPPPSTIVKCYQGIVIGRYDYAGSTVRGTGPDITAIRLSELATLLTNRHDNT